MTPTSIIMLMELFIGGQAVEAQVGTPRGDAMAQLLADDMIVAQDGAVKLTDRGYCYVTAVASIPLPTLKWVMPPLRFQ